MVGCNNLFSIDKCSVGRYMVFNKVKIGSYGLNHNNIIGVKLGFFNNFNRNTPLIFLVGVKW